MMNETHRDNIRQYVNDVIAMERDIVNAIQLQEGSGNVAFYPKLRELMTEMIRSGEERIDLLRKITEAEGGSFGAAVKEGIMAVTGVFAGLYGRIREHPVSRMVRDDIIAMDVAATSYSMLLTLGLATGHAGCVEAATTGLRACPSLVIRLTDLLPEIVCSELAKDAPLANADAAETALDRIRNAWETGP